VAVTAPTLSGKDLGRTRQAAEGCRETGNAARPRARKGRALGARDPARHRLDPDLAEHWKPAPWGKETCF